MSLSSDPDVSEEVHEVKLGACPEIRLALPRHTRVRRPTHYKQVRLRHLYFASMSEKASSSSNVPSKSARPKGDDVDIEKLLSREANEFQREMEVERILKAFKLKYV